MSRGSKTGVFQSKTERILSNGDKRWEILKSPCGQDLNRNSLSSKHLQKQPSGGSNPPASTGSRSANPLSAPITTKSAFLRPSCGFVCASPHPIAHACCACFGAARRILTPFGWMTTSSPRAPTILSAFSTLTRKVLETSVEQGQRRPSPSRRRFDGFDSDAIALAAQRTQTLQNAWHTSLRADRTRSEPLPKAHKRSNQPDHLLTTIHFKAWPHSSSETKIYEWIEPTHDQRYCGPNQTESRPESTACRLKTSCSHPSESLLRQGGRDNRCD